MFMWLYFNVSISFRRNSSCLSIYFPEKLFTVTEGAIVTALKKKKFSKKKYILEYIPLELDNEPLLTTKTN